MKKIVILGGGISGLSLLWYLKKKYENQASITLFEKSSRVGGWIQTVKKEGYLFERGPRSCRTAGNGKATLKLIEELGIQDQVILADHAAHSRYLYLNQSLHKIPSRFLSLLFSPLTRKILPHLLMEWKVPAGRNEDESIHAFFTRRLGKEAAETFADALTLGIYAGDSKMLSMQSCFPEIFRLEREYGSLLKGAVKKIFVKSNTVTSPFIKQIQKASLFSFKEGMEYLPKTLAKALEKNIFTDHGVQGMHFHSAGITLQLNDGKTFEADQVFSTLAPQALVPLIAPHNVQTAELLSSIKASSVAVVGLAYNQNQLPYQGFGHLIPSKERENVLGVVWDSCVFPQQSNSSTETRLTVMIKDDPSLSDEEKLKKCACEALFRQLKINTSPNSVDIYRARLAIPQYTPGYSKKKEAILHAIRELSPHLQLLGSAFSGVAVNDCIANSYKQVGF